MALKLQVFEWKKQILTLRRDLEHDLHLKLVARSDRREHWRSSSPFSSEVWIVVTYLHCVIFIFHKFLAKLTITIQIVILPRELINGCMHGVDWFATPCDIYVCKISLLVFVMRLGSRKGDRTTKSLRWSTNSKHSTDMANIYPSLKIVLPNKHHVFEIWLTCIM